MNYTIFDYWGIEHDVIPILTKAERRSILELLGWHHTMSNASIVNNCLYNFTKQNSNNSNKILVIDYVLESVEFLLLHDFIQ